MQLKLSYTLEKNEQKAHPAIPILKYPRLSESYALLPCVVWGRAISLPLGACIGRLPAANVTFSQMKITMGKELRKTAPYTTRCFPLVLHQPKLLSYPWAHRSTHTELR